MELIFYALSLALEIPPLKLSNGNEIVWIRYVSWMMTCPVLLCQISGLPAHGDFDGQTIKKTVILMLANQAMILSGISAAFFDEIKYKLPLLCVSFGSFAVCITIVSQTALSAFMHYPGRAKQQLVIVVSSFICGWVIFPVLYLLGPETSGAIDQEKSLIAHCIGDLLAKNFFGYVSYQLNWNVLPKTIGEAENDETQGEPYDLDKGQAVLDVEKALHKQANLEARFQDKQRPETNTPSTMMMGDPVDYENQSGRSTPNRSGANTPPTLAQQARRGSFAQPVKVRTPKGGSGSNTPRATTPRRTGDVTPPGSGTPRPSTREPERVQIPQGPVDGWVAPEVVAMLNSFGFRRATQIAMESALDGETLASLTAEELMEELELTKLQVKRVLSAMGRSVTPQRSPRPRSEQEFEEQAHTGPALM
jgi:hypothetical protein